MARPRAAARLPNLDRAAGLLTIARPTLPTQPPRTRQILRMLTMSPPSPRPTAPGSAEHPPSPAPAPGPVHEPPQCTHDAESPEVREQLEALDDAMFGAIAGTAGSLAEAHRLWIEAVVTLPSVLIEEAREQYLRYAAEVARRGDSNEGPNHTAMIAAIEVMELLARP